MKTDLHIAPRNANEPETQRHIVCEQLAHGRSIRERRMTSIVKHAQLFTARPSGGYTEVGPMRRNRLLAISMSKYSVTLPKLRARLRPNWA